MRLAHVRHRPEGRRPAARRRSHGGGRRDEGAIIIEMATVVVFLCTLLSGAYDLGMGWRTTLAVTESARAGARVGSALGTERGADRDLLLSMRATLDASGMLDEVERVVIYQSASANGQVPPSCLTGTSNGTCNVLTGAQLTAISDTSAYDANTGCIVNSSRKAFCPATRQTIPDLADYLGIYVRVRHDYVFPFLGESMTIERTAVMRMEP